jgi:serine/threonine protein phosphatase PrpC
MLSQLKVSVGQYSDKGHKQINQDFHGVYIPEEPQLTSKGIAIALADGISSSDVGQIASESTVTSFLEDYYSTSETWSVKKSAQQVLTATNSWLYSQTQQSQNNEDKDRGFVCTLSAMVIKSTMAHIFHVGDTRIYRLRDNLLEQLTKDHRLWVAQDKSYLSRAMGINHRLELDYQTLKVEKGDVFLLATDGIYEFVDSRVMIRTINQYTDDLDTAATVIVETAYANESNDNLTIQVIRVDELPSQDADEIYQQLTELPFPPILEAGQTFDGCTIIRELHASSRSHVYLALDNEPQPSTNKNTQVIIKIPSIDLRGNAAYLERFLMEEWIARRINSTYVLKSITQNRQRHFMYILTEYIEGQTLTQWMIDNPKPDLETVRGIVEQIAKGLRAFHRLEMLYQDLKPDNIMIDSMGTVKVIDFGSTKVAGVMEISTPIEQAELQGTAQYAAPEYMLGESGTPQSDLFSLGVISYQMLTGKLPYGAEVAKSTTKSAQRKLTYNPIAKDDRGIPIWIDGALCKAVHPDPSKRYEELSAFLFDLRNPNKEFLNMTRPPLLERDPVVFWQGVSFILAVIIVILLNN